jgi:hypothetical protein
MENQMNSLNKKDEAGRGGAYVRFFARIPNMISKTIQLARPIVYATQISSSVKYEFPNIVKPLYAVSIGYIFGDIAIKYYDVHNKNSEYRKWFLIDLSIWHLMASFVLPAIVINRYIHYIAKTFGKMNFPLKVIKFGPAISAICLIPFIIQPLDNFTDWTLDRTYRQYFDYNDYDDIPVSPHQIVKLPEYFHTKETKRD